MIECVGSNGLNLMERGKISHAVHMKPAAPRKI